MKNGVVIVTYNRLELLKECIGCVCSQSLPFSDVILVNNCSTDGTTEYLDAWSAARRESMTDGPVVTVLHQKENLGGAGGFYAGLAAAGQKELDWVLLIDDDAMIACDYMERLLACKKNLSEGTPPAMAGSVWTAGKLDLTHRRRIKSKLLFIEQPVAKEAYQDVFVCDCATFCGLVISGRALQDIGLPKKEYFIWYDDSEYCLRLAAQGGITVVPEARLNHKTKLPGAGDGLLERTGWRHYYGYRNRLDTARIHFGAASVFCIALEYHVLSLCSRLMMLLPAKREKGRFNIQMIRDALSDGKNGRLGKRETYHP